MFGEFLEVDKDSEASSWGNSLRLRVAIDITKPLRRGFMLKADGINKDCWFTIRYERLCEFCFGCGTIGHVVKDCLSGGRMSNLERDNLEFGAWLKFQGFF